MGTLSFKELNLKFLQENIAEQKLNELWDNDFYDFCMKSQIIFGEDNYIKFRNDYREYRKNNNE